MNNPAVEPALARLKLVAVIRTADPETAVEVGRALLKGGVSAAELTFTIPDAPVAIRELAAEWPGRVGAGTVLTPPQGEQALEAGAAFLVSPVILPELALMAHEAGALAVLGGLTPNELVAAVTAQADLIKLFPVGAVGGPSYVKSVLEPLPTLQLMVSGGISKEEVRAYLDLGVRSVALGGALMPPALVDARDWSGLEAHARTFADLIPDDRPGTL